MEYTRTPYAYRILYNTGRLVLIKKPFAQALATVPGETITPEVTHVFTHTVPRPETQQDPLHAPSQATMQLPHAPPVYLARVPPAREWSTYPKHRTTIDGKHITQIQPGDLLWVPMPERHHLPMHVAGTRDQHGTPILAVYLHADKPPTNSTWTEWQHLVARVDSANAPDVHPHRQAPPPGTVCAWLLAMPVEFTSADPPVTARALKRHLMSFDDFHAVSTGRDLQGLTFNTAAVEEMLQRFVQITNPHPKAPDVRTEGGGTTNPAANKDIEEFRLQTNVTHATVALCTTQATSLSTIRL